MKWFPCRPTQDEIDDAAGPSLNVEQLFHDLCYMPIRESELVMTFVATTQQFEPTVQAKHLDSQAIRRFKENWDRLVRGSRPSGRVIVAEHGVSVVSLVHAETCLPASTIVSQTTT